MSVYLNRFLNVPAARIPEPKDTIDNPENLLNQLPDLLNRQQQVNEVGKLVAHYLYSGGKPELLMATLGKLMLRENRDFYVIQEIEAAFKHYYLLGKSHKEGALQSSDCGNKVFSGTCSNNALPSSNLPNGLPLAQR